LRLKGAIVAARSGADRSPSVKARHMARYLVTGGAGFIGSHLVEALIADGQCVRVLDDLSTGRAENLPRGVELIAADVTQERAVRQACDGVDGCFHLAAVASVERSRREWLRSHKVNLAGAITLFAEACRAQGTRGRPLPVVYASSAAVYGDAREIPLSENTPPGKRLWRRQIRLRTARCSGRPTE
jgi:UDP-glucose 4-epimerase